MVTFHKFTWISFPNLKFPSKIGIAPCVHQRAKCINDCVCATKNKKCLKFDRCLGTMIQCAVLLNDLVDEVHVRTPDFRRKLPNSMNHLANLKAISQSLQPYPTLSILSRLNGSCYAIVFNLPDRILMNGLRGKLRLHAA